MKAQISRTLVLKSPIELYKILRNKEELQINPYIQSFIKITDEYLNGCQCIADIKFSLMNEEYNILSNNVEFIDLLKSNIQCDNIIFENNLL
jgi:hypothetical protein